MRPQSCDVLNDSVDSGSLFCRVTLHSAKEAKMIRPRKFLVPAILIAALVGIRAEAQVRAAPEKLRIAYSAIGSSQSPLWIAHEAGIFKKHGLDVEMVYLGGGSRAAQVVVSGEVPVAMFNGGAAISAHFSPPHLLHLASGMNVLP